MSPAAFPSSFFCCRGKRRPCSYAFLPARCRSTPWPHPQPLTVTPPFSPLERAPPWLRADLLPSARCAAAPARPTRSFTCQAVAAPMPHCSVADRSAAPPPPPGVYALPQCLRRCPCAHEHVRSPSVEDPPCQRRATPLVHRRPCHSHPCRGANGECPSGPARPYCRCPRVRPEPLMPPRAALR